MAIITSRVSEGVVRLSDRGPDKEWPGPNDELHEIFDAGEALLNRLLVFHSRDVVGEVAQARQETPVLIIRNVCTLGISGLLSLTCRLERR